MRHMTLLCSLLLWAAPAWSIPITFDYAGVITSVGGTAPDWLKEFRYTKYDAGFNQIFSFSGLNLLYQGEGDPYTLTKRGNAQVPEPATGLLMLAGLVTLRWSQKMTAK